MKIKDIIKGVIISVSAIVIGYFAVGLPLNLFFTFIAVCR